MRVLLVILLSISPLMAGNVFVGTRMMSPGAIMKAKELATTLPDVSGLTGKRTKGLRETVQQAQAVWASRLKLPDNTTAVQLPAQVAKLRRIDSPKLVLLWTQPVPSAVCSSLSACSDFADALVCAGDSSSAHAGSMRLGRCKVICKQVGQVQETPALWMVATCD